MNIIDNTTAFTTESFWSYKWLFISNLKGNGENQGLLSGCVAVETVKSKSHK